MANDGPHGVRSPPMFLRNGGSPSINGIEGFFVAAVSRDLQPSGQLLEVGVPGLVVLDRQVHGGSNAFPATGSRPAQPKSHCSEPAVTGVRDIRHSRDVGADAVGELIEVLGHSAGWHEVTVP